MECNRCCRCGCHNNDLSTAQMRENTTLKVPVKALDNYELAKVTGWNGMGPDTTINEFFAKIKGEPGINGSGIQIEGNLDSYAELLAIIDPKKGDSYAVKTGDQALLYTYGVNGWPAEGEGIPIQGEPGADGNTYIPISLNELFDN